MARNSGIYNKGSILPSIVEMEEELIERENEAKRLAEEKILVARLSGEKLIANTIEELPKIEEEERKRLIETADARVEELKSIEERELREIQESIETNRKLALDFILKKVIP